MASVGIGLVGDDAVGQLIALREWLQTEPELRGRVRRVDQPIRPGELGGTVEQLVVALASGGVGVTLTQSLIAWLRSRPRSTRSKLVLTVTRGDRTASLEIGQADLRQFDEALAVLHAVLSAGSDE
ncbi:hypothetical protein [Streptomyces sp. NPDC008092]|uniref:effector-associated constant component EACC1 n=1 Tax=Streptomyces sp. NPDC008092 TaxID=3364808 RepID=UPI0036E31330